LRDGQRGFAQIAQRVDRVGEIEEAAGVYAETKIEELAERKFRFDEPELAQKWDRIQRKEREDPMVTHCVHLERTNEADTVPGCWGFLGATGRVPT
jgi:hypothetical protein